MSKTKTKKIYKVEAFVLGKWVENRRIFEKRHNAAKFALAEEGRVVEYELVRSSVYLPIVDLRGRVTCIKNTEEAKLLYD